MNGCITTDEHYQIDDILPKLKAYTTGKVVEKVTCKEKYVLEGDGPKVALLDLGAKRNIARSLNERGCEVTVYPALTSAEEILACQSGRHHAFQRTRRPEGVHICDRGDQKALRSPISRSLRSVSDIS